MRTKHRQIDLDELVVKCCGVLEYLWICPKVLSYLVRCISDVFASSGLEITTHSFVVPEERSSGANLCAHIAYGRLSGATQ